MTDTLTLEEIEELERERTLAASEGGYIILHPKRAKKLYALARTHLEAQGEGWRALPSLVRDWETFRDGKSALQIGIPDWLRQQIDETVTALKEQQATLAAKEAEIAGLKEALTKIMKTPNRPFPDVGAHSWRAFAMAVHSAWIEIQTTAHTAIEKGK